MNLVGKAFYHHTARIYFIDKITTSILRTKFYQVMVWNLNGPMKYRFENGLWLRLDKTKCAKSTVAISKAGRTGKIFGEEVRVLRSNNDLINIRTKKEFLMQFEKSSGLAYLEANYSFVGMLSVKGISVELEVWSNKTKKGSLVAVNISDDKVVIRDLVDFDPDTLSDSGLGPLD